jgi:lipopolysaccharide heptosyltransferase II
MAPVDWKAVKRIAVLNFIPSTVGDSLALLPFVQRLKREAPHAEILLTGSSVTKQILGDEPSISEFIELLGLPELAKQLPKLTKARIVWNIIRYTARELKRRKPDIAFVLLPNFAPYQLVPWLAGIPLRFGFTYPGSVFSWTLTDKRTYRNPETTKETDVHFYQANLELLELAGITVTRNDWKLRRTMTKREHDDAAQFLVGTRKPVVAFQVGAKYKNRQWPPERFAHVGKALVAKGASIILVGSPAEIEMCETVRKGIGAHCINLAGKTTFGQLAGILAKCDLVVGNDSGLMHLAASVGAQTLVLFGSPHPNHSRPIGAKEAVIITPPSWNPNALFENEPRDVVSKYLLAIDEKTVADACLQTLAGKPPKNRWTS